MMKNLLDNQQNLVKKIKQSQPGIEPRATLVADKNKTRTFQVDIHVRIKIAKLFTFAERLFIENVQKSHTAEKHAIGLERLFAGRV